MNSVAWLNWAAVITWLVVSLPTLVDIAAGTLRGPAAAGFVAAFLGFGVTLALCLYPTPRIRLRAGRPGLVIETLCGLAMVYLAKGSAPGATLVIVAAQLPYFVSSTAAWTWVAAQTIALAAIFTGLAGWLDALSGSVALGGFQMFAIATSTLVLSEREARAALTNANTELTAARELLAENTRAAERLRISRDLHDTLGHHLTALSLQLDVASRLTSGQAAEHVLEAHAITRLLLSDVRNVVSELRETGRVDLAAAVRGLAESTRGLDVHVAMPDRFDVDDAGQAQALLRCAQEIITNASRHAMARNLWISIQRSADGVRLDARDDGQGSAAVVFGNGLKGMRERFEAYAGRIEVISAAGRGFEVHAVMPLVDVALAQGRVHG